MWKQAGKKGILMYEEWTDCGFRTAQEVAYTGEVALVDDNDGPEAVAAALENIETDNTRRLKYTCCKGSLDNRHCIVTLEEPPNRVWYKYRVRAHNYAGWGGWAEVPVGVGFP